MRAKTLVCLLIGSSLVSAAPAGDVAAVRREAEEWRAQHRIIDLHQHVDGTAERLSRCVKIMDAVGLGMGVNLSGGTVTRPADGGPSEFERTRTLSEGLYPGRFLVYMNLDYSGWDEPDFAARAAKQIEEGRRLGAAGFKEFKRLGLSIRDRAGRLIRIDDPRLDPMWRRCGELGMPVSIHVADPRAFWMPYNAANERWKELKDHPHWWFGDTNKFPAREDLLAALDRVIGRHPETTFVSVHFANNAEDLGWVDAALNRHPNMMADLAARIPEVGRHNPEVVRRLFVKYQDRILFATDFQVYDRLILGSSGDEPPPTDADAEVFYAKEWRWLETRDRNWPHMTPIQGDWPISSIGLPAPVLRKVYFDNARRLLGRSLPLPVVRARHISQDFVPNGAADAAVWQTAEPVVLECQTLDYQARPELATRVRLLWSSRYLYLAYECPFTRLTVFQPPYVDRERYAMGQRGVSLWDRDVVEAFIRSDPEQPNRYCEFQVAPTGERLDLRLALPDRDFAWSSGFDAAVRVDRRARVWTCEWRIPLETLGGVAPKVGAHWRVNLFRCDRANSALLAWSPTLTGNFHTPEKFGVLEFAE